MFPDRYATLLLELYQGRSVGLYPDNSAILCQNRFLDRNALMYLGRNVRMSPSSSAPMFQDRHARMFPGKNVKMSPDRSAIMFLDKFVIMSQDNSARMYPGKNARMFPDRFATL